MSSSSEWVSDYWFIPIEKNFSYIMARTIYIFDEMMMMVYALY